jgi:SNF2 family DNA or RNA helicase
MTLNDRISDPAFRHGPEPAVEGRRGNESQLQILLNNIPEGTSLEDAKSDKSKLKDACRSFGNAKVTAQDGKWLIKGMKSTLYHHQLLGAQWMIRRELSVDPPFGGLLADGMGLGKTIQTLACMVGNPPSPDDVRKGMKATLIVVPSSVIDQWMYEIATHCHNDTFPKVMQYKASSKIPLAVLCDLDIVITSYTEVMKQFPFPDDKGKAEIAAHGYQKWWRKARKNLGVLHQIHWYRVVLDEAQMIKNNTCRTSLACQGLQSVFRWCLTGTPLLNCLEE